MHIPVLLNEVIEYLNLASGKNIVDATLDGGGYALAILEKIGPEGKLLGIELDGELFKQTETKIHEAGFEKSAILVNDSYVNLKTICEEKKFEPDGIVFDLGLSSWHLEASGRGFSFKKDEPLDMRFSPAAAKTALGVVNQYGPEELEKIIGEYGEEQFAGSIARSIVKARREKPLMTTLELVKAIETSVPEWYKHRKIHFATKTFQAIRIEVNDELNNVKKGVAAAIDVLKKDGIFLFTIFPKSHVRDSIKINDLFEDFDSAENHTKGFANFDGVKVPTFIREPSYYDEVFEGLGFEKLLEFLRR